MGVVVTRMGPAPDDDASRKRDGACGHSPELIGCRGMLRRPRKCGRERRERDSGESGV